MVIPDRPERHDRREHAEHDMRPERVLIRRERKHKGPDDQPNSEQASDPLLPFGKGRNRRERQNGDDDADDPGVLSGLSVAMEA